MPSDQYLQCKRFFGAFRQNNLQISENREGFSLEQIRNASSLIRHGGGHSFQATHVIPLLSETLQAGIEMVYRNPFLVTNTLPSSQNQLDTQVVLKGAMKNMKYQAEYGYSGQNSGKGLPVNPQDRMGGKFRWEWELPFITPRIELSRFVNNANFAPTNNQTISTQQRFALDWTIPDFPRVTLMYSQEQNDIFNGPDESHSASTLMKRVSTKISLTRPSAQAEWSSHYSTFQNTFHDQGILEEIHTNVKGTLYTFPKFDISPTIGFTRQTNTSQRTLHDRTYALLGSTIRLSPTQNFQPNFEWTYHRIGRHPSFSKTFSSKFRYSYHSPTQGFRISLTGKYVFHQSSQKPNNPQTYDISVFVQKNIQGLLDLHHQEQFISLKLSHNQNRHSSALAAQSPGSSAMLLLTISP